nr:PREDICTED: uncharacterized protein LOC100876789 isoform X3 [Megachile rotundata]
MAFMMPVVKNEWDIYKTNRSRRSSECSNPQACRSRKVGVGMLKIRRSLVVYVAWLGLFDVAGSPFGAPHFPPLLEDVLEGVSKLAAEPQQEHRLVPAENRQLQLLEQVPQPTGRQAEEVSEEG